MPDVRDGRVKSTDVAEFYELERRLEKLLKGRRDDGDRPDLLEMESALVEWSHGRE